MTSPTPTPAFRSISIWALLPALVVPLLGSLLYFVVLPGNAFAQVCYTGTKLFTIIYPLCFVGWKTLFTQKPKASRRTILLWGLLSGLAISALGFALMASPIGEIIRGGSDAITEKATLLGFAKHYLLFAVFITVFHSALEEFYWRGFVYGQLRARLGKLGSHTIAALAFAAHHLVVTLQFFPTIPAILLALCVGIGGAIWSMLYERQGSLLGCWVSHLCVDAFLMVIGYQLIFG